MIQRIVSLFVLFVLECLSDDWRRLFMDAANRHRAETAGQKKEKLLLWFERFVFGEDRRYGPGGYGTPHECCELAAVMDVRYLEADDKPETEAGDAD
jgi:hypothetical protein